MVGVLASLTAACSEPEPLITTAVDVYNFLPGSHPRVDILFVVERSWMMAPYRDRIVDEVPNALLRYLSMPWLPYVHIAGISTDLDDNGVFRSIPGVAAPFASDTGSNYEPRISNFDRPLRAILESLLDPGSSGTPAKRQPLEAVKIALANQPEGFQQGSYLEIVLVLAGDDESPGTAAAAFSAFSYPNQVFVYAIAPTDTPRLQAFGELRTSPRYYPTPIDGPFDTAFMGVSTSRLSTIEGHCVAPPARDCVVTEFSVDVDWVDTSSTNARRSVGRAGSPVQAQANVARGSANSGSRSSLSSRGSVVVKTSSVSSMTACSRGYRLTARSNSARGSSCRSAASCRGDRR